MLSLAFECAHGGETNTEPDLSMYAQSEVFAEALILHTNATWNLQQTNMLVMSVFGPNPGMVHQIYVNEAGVKHECGWWTFNLRRGGSAVFYASQLPKEKLQSLRLAINEVPAENVSPPIERLVMVSFPKGTNWVTRCYDSGTPPKSVQQLSDILGVKFETNAPPRTGF
jgi:hypothetical protein